MSLELILHHTTGATLGADRSDDWVRNIDNQHHNQGWAGGIGYSWLWDRYGNVFEGRGWGYVGAHTMGWNSKAHAAAYLGNGAEPQTREGLEALRWIVAQHDLKYGVRPITGHRSHNETHCPGNWIFNHRHEIRNLDPVPVPQPGPVVLPAPSGPGPTNDFYSVEAMVTALPVLRRGSSGQHVRIAQGLLVANGRKLTVDGDFGAGTESALREWQGAAGIGIDGVCGPATWRRLLCI
jgi:peptidoglycan hydrolase-like protein with peptidoglycan-binding domain